MPLSATLNLTTLKLPWNPSPELLAVLLHELTGRDHDFSDLRHPAL